MAKKKGNGCILAFLIIGGVLVMSWFASDYEALPPASSDMKDKSFSYTKTSTSPIIKPKTPQEIEAEKLKKESYDAGFKDGWLVGKTDAWQDRKRDGQKAIRLGEINAHGRSDDQKEYAKGYHHGYNEGWHAAVRVGAPGGKR